VGLFTYAHKADMERREREAEEMRQRVLQDLIVHGRSDVAPPSEDKAK
jgi:hypothetical protein